MKLLNITIDERDWDASIAIFGSVLSVSITVFGVLGNSLVIYVCSCVLRDNARFFVPFLAVSDLLQIVAAGLFFLALGQQWTFPDEILCKVWVFTLELFFYLTVSFILLATVQVVIAFLQPFNVMSRKRGRIIAWINITFWLLYTFPTVFVSEVHYITVYEKDNQTRQIETCLPFPRDEITLFVFIYNFINDGLSLTIVGALICLCIWMGYFICKRLIGSNKALHRDKSSRALIYLVLTVGNLIFFIPTGAMRIIIFASESQFFKRKEWDTILLCYQLYLLSSVMNPSVFIIFDKKVRKAVKKLLQKCRTGKKCC